MDLHNKVMPIVVTMINDDILLQRIFGLVLFAGRIVVPLRVSMANSASSTFYCGPTTNIVLKAIFTTVCKADFSSIFLQTYSVGA